MKRTIFSGLAAVVLCSALFAQEFARTPIHIPNIPGFVTVKCDFHMHSVFSDGTVWPDVRPMEAWKDGLDAIALTEHLEHQSHEKDIPTNRNRSHEIALEAGRGMGIIVIKGAEITRPMPPGHFNALFIMDADSLATKDWRDAFSAAKRQGAFIFWNHPGWTGQQPDGIAKWYPEHDELLSQGKMHGIEIVNGGEYYPEAHQWCLEKGLTMLGNSDIHAPIHLYSMGNGDSHRPHTLVFAKEKTESGIKEALLAGRTAVYLNGTIYGKKEFLEPLFRESIKIVSDRLALKYRQRGYVQIQNNSDIPYKLERVESNPTLESPKVITLAPGKVTAIRVRCIDKTAVGRQTITLSYKNANLVPAPGESLTVNIPVEILFE